MSCLKTKIPKVEDLVCKIKLNPEKIARKIYDPDNESFDFLSDTCDDSED
jgi:hypothetical protein